VSGSGYALIAEFDRHQAALYRQIVEGLGLEAVIVRDGNAAKALLQTRGAPAVMITDPSLPGTDGFSLITDLRRRFPASKAAVLVFSAFAELRATASDLLVNLGIAEVGDKSATPTAIRDAVTRALATIARGERSAPAESKAPEDLANEFLRGIARTFHVPIALLAVDLPQHRWFTAYAAIAEPLSGDHDRPQWGPMFQQVLTGRQPLVVPDVSTLFGASPVIPPMRIRGFVAVPFTTSRDRVIGVLSLLDLKPLALGPEQIDGLIDLARPMADEFARRYLAEPELDTLTNAPRTEESWAALERLALTDALTGLYNRHAGEQAIAREAARNRRTGSGLSLALLDLDNFKLVNDLHGHEAGDRVLAEVGLILKASFRASDLAIRWGGDEFLILLPDVALGGAAAFAERARMQVEALSFSGVGRVTLSAGVVEVGRKEDALVALKRADANLYAAKAGGRNRVTSAAGNPDTKMKSG
jgi:diguanylate cyclase (GGDEF)-like protein